MALPQPGTTSYRPVIAIFAMTALMAMMGSLATLGTPSPCARCNGSSL
jgi:hypothetical protein